MIISGLARSAKSRTVVVETSLDSTEVRAQRKKLQQHGTVGDLQRLLVRLRNGFCRDVKKVEQLVDR